jgi:septum formation protein
VTPIVLASASPRRLALLEALGVEVDVQTSGVDEVTEGPPREVVLANARAKRDDVAARLDSPAIVVAADTEVFLDGRVLGKPSGLDDARAMLRHLSGRVHEVYTGVAVADTLSGRLAEDVEVTQVHFRELSDRQIDAFVDAVRPLDRAGAYTVDGPGSLLVARYEGCFQNVLGLPMVRLDALLESLGHSLFDRVDASRARFL